MEGALALDETKEFDEMFNTYTQAVEEKSQLIDDFVDELTGMAKRTHHSCVLSTVCMLRQTVKLTACIS